MRLGIPQQLFPDWTAALVLVKDNGLSAWNHANAAVRAGDGATRLDEAIRTTTSLDHAIDNANKLPLEWLFQGATGYVAGYNAAREAVLKLVSSGIIPAAAERVGRASFLDARESFTRGIATVAGDQSRYGAKPAAGRLEASLEDAANGVRMLRTDNATARALLSGIDQVRTTATAGRVPDATLVARVNSLFDTTNAQLTKAIDSAPQLLTAPSPAKVADVFQETDRLLGIAADTAKKIVTDARGSVGDKYTPKV